jgi:Tfp pilus assembly protein PilN
MRQADFLPESIRQQRVRRRDLVRQGYLLAACLLGMCMLTYLRHGRTSQVRAENGMLLKDVAEKEARIQQIPPLQQQMADLLIKKKIDEELGSRTNCRAMLAEVSRVLPASMCLTKLEMKTIETRIRPDSSSAASARSSRQSAGSGQDDRVRRVQMVIGGLAPNDVDVANFIGQLSASPLFENVHMGYTKTVVFRGRSAREFQASCYLVR